MKFSLAVGLLLALVSMAAAQKAEDRIVFRKVFAGSNPEFQEIAVDRTGTALYKEAKDDPNPVGFKVGLPLTAEIFELADSLGHFTRKLESDLPIARMGEKTFQFEGATPGSQTYNYSVDPSVQKLQEYFEKMGESQRLFIKLEYTVRFDRLGVYDALTLMDQARTRERLIGTEHFLPLLDRIAKNKRFMNIARDRADALARYIRESNAIPAP